jgi:hypothetical protein
MSHYRPSRGWSLATRAAVLLVVTALLVAAAGRLDLTRIVRELVTLRPGWIAAALLCYAAILPLWALQWRLLAPAPRPGFRRMFGVIVMTSSVLNTAPMLVGEAAGIALLVSRAGLSRAAALSVLAMDQLLVGVAKTIVLATAAAMVVLPVWMWRGMTALATSVALLLLVLGALAWRGEHLHASRLRLLSVRLAHAASAASVALAPLRSPARGGGALCLALGKKFVEVLAILCVQRAFGLSLPFSSGVLVLAALNLATLLPVVPGNVGVYEAAVVVAYRHLGVSSELALGVAVVQHACYFVALALPGYRWLARAALSRSAIAAS